jgi:hypothetical protein
MKFGMRVRSALGAPLALGLAMMVGTAHVARAQTQPPPQPTEQPPSTQQPPTTQQPAQPTQQQPAQQAPAQAESPTFTAPAGLLLVQIKPDKTADYEAMITKLRDALAKSEKPERKAMAKSWKIYKATEPAAGNTLYVHIIETAAPGDYANPLRIISEVFPTEVQDIYTKVKEGFVQTGLLNLTLLQDLGSTAASGAVGQANPPVAPK